MRSFKARATLSPLWAMLAAIMALACSGSGEEEKFVGHWEHIFPPVQEGDSFSRGNRALAEEADKKLDINADNTFTLHIYDDVETGTWEYADGTIKLFYETEEHWHIGFYLHIGDGGDTLLSEPNFQGKATSFARK